MFKTIFIALLALSFNAQAESFCYATAGLWLNDIIWQYDLTSNCKNIKNKDIQDSASGFLLIKPSQKSMFNAKDRFIKKAEKAGYQLIFSSLNRYGNGYFVFGTELSVPKADYCIIKSTRLPDFTHYTLECDGWSVKETDAIYSKGNVFDSYGPDTMLEPLLVEQGFVKIDVIHSKYNNSVTLFKRPHRQ